MRRLFLFNPGHLHLAMICCLVLLAAGAAWAEEGPRRVVAAGGTAAEIVYALGQGDRLIARDTTSSYPPQVMDLPDVGYVRRLSPENLIALDPDLILAEHDAGPPETIEVLTRAGVPLVVLPEAQDPAGVLAKIEAVAEALGVPADGTRLLAQVSARLDDARAAVASMPANPRVMFILSMQGGRILASGTGTSADAMIRLAGGVNAVEGIEGYKPLTDEAVIAAAPDMILMMDRGGGHDAAVAEVVAHPAISATPAGQAARVIRMNGLYLLGFGPRSGDAALELNAVLRALLGTERG
jgi:iron complex transport system substrate-binding protein